MDFFVRSYWNWNNSCYTTLFISIFVFPDRRRMRLGRKNHPGKIHRILRRIDAKWKTTHSSIFSWFFSPFYRKYTDFFIFDHQCRILLASTANGLVFYCDSRQRHCDIIILGQNKMATVSLETRYWRKRRRQIETMCKMSCWHVMERHDTSWNIMGRHGKSWNNIELHGTSQIVMELYRTSWDVMKRHECHRKSRDVIKHFGTS